MTHTLSIIENVVKSQTSLKYVGEVKPRELGGTPNVKTRTIPSRALKKEGVTTNPDECKGVGFK